MECQGFAPTILAWACWVVMGPAQNPKPETLNLKPHTIRPKPRPQTLNKASRVPVRACITPRLAASGHNQCLGCSDQGSRKLSNSSLYTVYMQSSNALNLTPLYLKALKCSGKGIVPKNQFHISIATDKPGDFRGTA